MVTENGACYTDVVAPDGAVADADRIRYLAGHLQAARDAIDEGVDLRAYFVWSLLDNFEWAFGFTKRFGLDPRRLRDPAPHAEEQRALVPAGDRRRGTARRGLRTARAGVAGRPGRLPGSPDGYRWVRPSTS